MAFLKSIHKKMPIAKVLYEDNRHVASTMPASVQLEGATARRRKRVGSRVGLCAAVFGLVYLGLGYRLTTISLSDPGKATALRQATQQTLSSRPQIVDRNGTLLATNRLAKGLAITTKDVLNAEDTAVSLAMALGGIDPEALANKIHTRKHVTLRHELTAEEEQRVLMLGLPGVVFMENEKRVYPQGALAAHAVGHIVPGKGGVMGLEGALEKEKFPTPQMQSSLDMTVQQILEEELSDTMQLYAAKASWGVIMDVHSGEVIALASLPDFNPNAPGSFDPDTRRNRVMYDRYELGSAFKAITAAAALEEGTTTLDQKYDVRQKLNISGRTISDFHPKGGFMTLSEMMEVSSNIGIAQVAMDLGGDQLKSYLGDLNLLTALETELPEKRDSDWPRRWRDLETATISYGHGIAVTPLQLTAAFAPVVNRGHFVKPTFWKQSDQATKKTEIFSAETSAAMRVILRRVVTDGTAKRAEADGYYVIGKTATADKPGVGGYRNDARISSFIGAFPGYDPKYVMLVSFDEPQATEESWGYATAGIVAAPTFSNIVARVGPALGLSPATDDHALAQFMSDLQPESNVQLAAAPRDFASESDAAELDELGQFLLELGP